MKEKPINNYTILSFAEYAKRMNDYTFTDYYYRLMLMARSVFEWKNLPNGIDEKWIEKYLFTQGKCMFFKDETLGFMVAGVTESNMLNPYDEPTSIRPIATNYEHTKEYENNVEAVIIRNNDDMIPTALTIQLYAYRLAEISRTIDVNVKAMKTPVLITCTDKQRYSLKQVYSQFSGNEPVIYGDKSGDFDSIKTLNTNAPVVFDKLQIHKHDIWNEVMTFLGIDNSNQDKRERLVTDEVSANDEQIKISAELMLKSRQKACEDINRIFGTNISVKLRECSKISEVDYAEDDIDIA